LVNAVFKRFRNDLLTKWRYRVGMTKPAASDHPAFWSHPVHDAAADIASMSKALLVTVSMAAGLTAGGRRVDLTGLDNAVGLLCAKTLDLPPAEGRAACAALLTLLTQVDALSLALRATSP